MDSLKNFRHFYCCCGCSLRIGCFLIAGIEFCYPILLTCAATESTTVIAVTWILYATAAILLLYGTIKDSKPVLLGWLTFMGVVMFLTFVGFFVHVHEIFEKSDERAKLITIAVIGSIFYFSVNGYFWTIVFSYYMNLKEKARREHNSIKTIT